jgi:hypothetical protein
LIEKYIDKNIKCLRTDNCLEFYACKWDALCKNKRIVKHRIVRNTP